MTDRSLVVVSAGIREPSSTRLLADRLTAVTVADLRAAGVGVEPHVIELREHARALADHLLAGFPSPELAEAIEAVRSADGLIAVTPIFNGSYSGLFKLFFDVLDEDSLAGLPVLIGATGGTPRHSLALDHALRPLFAYLDASVLPTGVFAATEDWGAAGETTHPGLQARIARAAGALADALRAERRHPVLDPFADPVPFDDLLRSVGVGDRPGPARPGS